MCCNCFKASTEALFNLTEADYQGIAQIIRESRSAQNIKIYLQDNYITPAKTKIIEDALQGLPLARFTMQNCAMGLNLVQDEYDNFDALFATLKDNKTVLVSLLWDDQVFMTQNYQPVMVPNQQPVNPQMQMMGMQYPQPMQVNMQVYPPQPIDPTMLMAPQMNPQMVPQMDPQLDPNQNPMLNPVFLNYLNSDPFEMNDTPLQTINGSSMAIYPQPPQSL
jgi:hypothetical protein